MHVVVGVGMMCVGGAGVSDKVGAGGVEGSAGGFRVLCFLRRCLGFEQGPTGDVGGQELWVNH